jgi:hypothetical protein
MPGSYNSAADEVAPRWVWPPTTSNLPLDKSVAVWPLRAVLRGVAVEKEAATPPSLPTQRLKSNTAKPKAVRMRLGKWDIIGQLTLAATEDRSNTGFMSDFISMSSQFTHKWS